MINKDTNVICLVFARGGSRSLQKKLGFKLAISIERGIQMAVNYNIKNNLK